MNRTEAIPLGGWGTLHSPSAPRGVFVSVFIPRILSILTIVVTIGMIVGTYKYFYQTVDEPAHVGAGMEWLAQGTYLIDTIDPPLARISVALGPYLMGLQPQGYTDNAWREGDHILHSAQDPDRALRLARLGTLPYFLLTAVLVWRRTRWWLGEWPAALAVILFSFTPTLLANAGLATTDICFTALFFLAVDRLWEAMEKPTLVNAVFAGAAVSFAVLAKFTAIPYLGLSCIALLILHWVRNKRLPAWSRMGAATIAALFVLAAGYRFSVGSLASNVPSSQQKWAHLATRGGAFRPLVAFATNHVPLNTFFQGILKLAKASFHKNPVFFLGKLRPHGVHSFYPISFLVKTPIPLTILFAIGAYFAVRAAWRGMDRYAWIVLIGTGCPFLFVLGTTMNKGTRHILVIYPFVIMLAALAAAKLWQAKRAQVVARAAVVLLVMWQIAGTVRAFPDFIPYFNEVAAPYQTEISVDSDLDWGQDLKRLIGETQKRQVDRLWLAYMGFAEADEEKLPPWKMLPLQKPVNGWVAISEQQYRTYHSDFAWLDAYQPVTRVGHSIRLYHIDETQPSSVDWETQPKVDEKLLEERF